MKTSITPEIMKKVWKLHNNGVDSSLIAETLGISSQSAMRIIKIMTAAQNGEDVDSISGNNHQKQKKFAKEFFGIEEKKAEKPIEEKPLEQQAAKPTLDDEAFRDYAIRVLCALDRTNELLERLCDAWGVKQ